MQVCRYQYKSNHSSRNQSVIDAKVEYKKTSRINQDHKTWLPHSLNIQAMAAVMATVIGRWIIVAILH